MFNRNPFENFNFRPRRPALTSPLVLQGVGLAVFVLLWWLIPHGLLIYLLIPAIAALIWAASFGWRQALSQLIEFLQTLEDRSFGGF